MVDILKIFENDDGIIIYFIIKKRDLALVLKIIVFSLITKHYWFKNKIKRVLVGFNEKKN